MSQSRCDKDLAKVIQQFSAIASGMEKAIKVGGKTEAKSKEKWDCALCQATGNWAARESCRSCSAPKQPAVLPPGLPAAPVTQAPPCQQVAPMEV